MGNIYMARRTSYFGVYILMAFKFDAVGQSGERSYSRTGTRVHRE